MLFQVGVYQVTVSLAIILCFIANLLWVNHPDYRSYTLYFTLSLLVLAPFVIAWKLWIAEAMGLGSEDLEDQRAVSHEIDLEPGIAGLSIGDVEEESLESLNHSMPTRPPQKLKDAPT